ncbi:MAG TPA: ATP-dependent DNA helicase RecG, partial [Candidatus Tenderia electrophaga]|nr:ATP-dependent DNA helicase RecG [Candidatus Tenderia electrophaga]
MALDSSLTALKGVGPRMAERLERLGLRSVEDLLFHLPYKYQDRTRVVAIAALQPGAEAVIEGEIDVCDIKFGRRRSLLCRLSDGSGSIMLRFFHFSAKQKQTLARGQRLRCYGEVRRGPVMLEMVHPEYRPLAEGMLAPQEEHLTPVYPATDGITQKTLRQLAVQALTMLHQGEVQDYLPPELLLKSGLPSLQQALQEVHQPLPDTPVFELLEGETPARQRLVLEELLAHHLSLRQLRHKAQQDAAPVLKPKGQLRKKILAALPFALTGAQQRVIAEIDADLAQPFPMQRLVQGDVGSGKTVVAAAAAVHAIEAGYQVAVMAPTELLAEQHRNNFAIWLQPLGLKIAWLSGKQGVKQRRENLALLASGEAALAVGTHALFQDEVMFDRLGLVVVDEQHRFGVHQRLALREKGSRDGRLPHQLIMTATPIPRTLAMTAYADLDNSVIDELPPGRTPVETVVISDERRDEVVARVHKACGTEGRQ